MILPIYVYGQPVLRKEAEDITPDYPNLKELIANMFETMNRADGVGLAAPQIGLFTSVLAHQAMLDGGLKKKDRQNKALVDEISATIILQSYLESKKYI